MLHEYKLYQPVKKLFESKGYSIYTEIPVLHSNRYVDIGVLKDNIVIAIEMKMSLTKKVIWQAHSCNLFADYIYIAIPTKPRDIEKCTKYGIGIIQIINQEAHILVEAKKIETWYNNYRKDFIKMCLQSNNNMAGLPTLKGQGPRIECIKKVKEYLLNNPKASWKELYNNIPNHYCHSKSMNCALRGLI